MRYFPRFLCVGAVLALTTLAAHAQPPASPGGPPAAPTISVKFTTVGIGASFKGLLYKATPGAPAPSVALSATQGRVGTNSYSYSGPATMEVFRVDTSPNAPSKYKVVGKATFDRNGSYVLYIAGTPDAINIAVASGSTTDFPLGSILFVNGGGFPARIDLTDDNQPKPVVKATKPLPLGGSVIMAVTQSLTVHFFRTDKKPPEEVTHVAVDANKSVRTTIILMPDLSLATISDDPAAAAANSTGSAGSGARGTGRNNGSGGNNRRQNGGGGGGG